ncbi:hypothetical protein [Rhodoferax aquaticus]|uniref:Uncharacterized protein n=1 Tax=Rhodoferax aquaticus TaxID=2527691 RepID=A0A515EJB8_9BURK|nr:hypothetical protein [Rhodoferax aquaticus]QDL52761.1 hypothetical protein EXZ61_00430 [Rhodoferax aquaticus]
MMQTSARTLVWGALFSIAAYAIPVGAQGTLAPVLSEASAGWLVTAAEAQAYKGEAGFDEAPGLRPRSVIPVIDILKPEPTADLKVKAPFAIAVEFKGQSDAQIDPSTFKVMYGALKIDITSRITKYVTVSKDGFTLDNAKIPPGKHRLILQIQDAKQRVAERELRVEVE